MDLYSLPELVIHRIFKFYYSEYVLKELKCDSCDYHGFPCLNCSFYTYKGKLGPGHIDNKRTFLPTDDLNSPECINMLVWFLKNN